MRGPFVLTILLALAITTAAQKGTTPDRSLTPGGHQGVTEADVCRPLYSYHARYVTEGTKKAVRRLYGVPEIMKSKYVIDHLIPIALGGSNEVGNLWPQLKATEPYSDIAKNQLGNLLKKFVCNKIMSLKEAQQMIAKDWRSAYHKYFPHKTKGRLPY